MKAAEDDEVVLRAPGGRETLTVLEVWYERIAVERFRIPPEFLDPSETAQGKDAE